MNSKFIISLFLVVVVFLSTCSKNPTDSKSAYTVRGVVEYAGERAENAVVAIDNTMNWTATTNGNGYFEIRSVSEGEHSLVASKSLADGSFSERTGKIAVYDDIELSAQRLPQAVRMHEPTDVTESKISLVWSQSPADDFREYKLYRHFTSGLDETTGTLVHVATEREDTLFTDDGLLPLERYFYRVYVMNEYGRLGGSNIVNAETGNYTVLENGDFESVDSSTGFASNWKNVDNNTGGTIELDTQVFHGGSQSVRYTIGKDGSGWEFWIYQTGIDPMLLVEGAHYRISGWCKLEAASDNNLDINFCPWFRDSNGGTIFKEFIQFTHSDEWREFSYDFVLPDSNTSMYKFDLWCINFSQADIVIWVDDVRFEKI